MPYCAGCFDTVPPGLRRHRARRRSINRDAYAIFNGAARIEGLDLGEHDGVDAFVSLLAYERKCFR